MQTIRIKGNIQNLGFTTGTEVNVDIGIDELRRVIKEHPELLKEEKLPFVERMIGKKCWWIDAEGDKRIDEWDNCIFDKQRLSVNNIFFTESYCDKEIARRKALGNILTYIRDNEIELVKDEDYLNFDTNKYEIDGWNYEYDCVSTGMCTYLYSAQFSLAFYSQEDREKVISNCAKDLETLLKK